MDCLLFEKDEWTRLRSLHELQKHDEPCSAHGVGAGSRSTPSWSRGKAHRAAACWNDLKSPTNGVLFGTDSFWTGVDVPGEALSNVIITRLPFAVPDHPLIEAKLEYH